MGISIIFFVLIVKQIIQMFISDVIFILDPDIKSLSAPNILGYWSHSVLYCFKQNQIKTWHPIEVETQSSPSS